MSKSVMGVYRLWSWSKEKVSACVTLHRRLPLPHPSIQPRAPYRTPFPYPHTPAQQQRDLLYVPTDLADFRGKHIIIDAASFLFWVMDDVMAKRVRCDDGRVCRRHCACVTGAGIALATFLSDHMIHPQHTTGPPTGHVLLGRLRAGLCGVESLFHPDVLH